MGDALGLREVGAAPLRLLLAALALDRHRGDLGHRHDRAGVPVARAGVPAVRELDDAERVAVVADQRDGQPAPQRVVRVNARASGAPARALHQGGVAARCRDRGQLHPHLAGLVQIDRAEVRAGEQPAVVRHHRRELFQ